MDNINLITILTIASLSMKLSDGATTTSPIETTKTMTEAATEANKDSGVTETTPAGVTEDQSNVTSCPRFNNRQENQTLYVPYIDGRCEMVVTVETVTLPPLRLVKMFKRGGRVIRRPVVSFRSVGFEENGEPVACESLPNRSLGPFVFVDTVVDRCQMLLKIKRRRKEAFNLLKQGQKKGWKPWKRPGERQGKRQGKRWFTFAPAYEYLDDVVY
ncbi:uncharacterized protein LOC117341043 [Pecten maximus]|uniref:uncharacterized protein LOC117341043 n=1 Tax=Pecten maximus TaxID=6579 RepID=UPI001458DFB9|nr:uncharacterized protein LOC117341043 [Pecten maximus]